MINKDKERQLLEKLTEVQQYFQSEIPWYTLLYNIDDLLCSARGEILRFDEVNFEDRRQLEWGKLKIKSAPRPRKGAVEPSKWVARREVTAWFKEGLYCDLCEFLMDVYEHHTPGLTKSALLTAAASFYWKGWSSSDFLWQSRLISNAFDTLCQEGVFTYVKGKPLIYRGGR